MECDYAFERTCRIFPEKKNQSIKNTIIYIHRNFCRFPEKKIWKLEVLKKARHVSVWPITDHHLGRETRELKQQRRRRRKRERHLKSEFTLLQTLSRLFHPVWFVKRWQFFLELNSVALYQSSGKEKESGCLVLPPSTKREFTHFHVAVVQRRQRNVQKKWCTYKVAVLPI